MDNLGYCCINQTLRKQNVYTSRTVIRKNFSIDKVSQLSLDNCKDLLKIIQWNIDNNINVFRISSDLFPRITDKINAYKFTDLITHKECSNLLSKAGKLAYDNNIVLSCHPGPYTVLASEKEQVVKSSIDELESHYLIYSLLRQEAPSLPFHINFHVGVKFSEEASVRFCKSFEKLVPEHIKPLIIIENDDKKACWSILKLYNHIYKRIGVPLTFDYHHSNFSREYDISSKEEFELAFSTWGDRKCKREVHYSSSESNTPKHSDYILEEIPDWLLTNKDIYIHLEAKQKELAVQQYRKEFLN
jgi:UV DNA damage endonuclease